MKQGLSLRVSQHLALTPQLQQSIRLLQLSTLELAQEIEQMLDENPFLEVNTEDTREEFGQAAENAPAAPDDFSSHSTGQDESSEAESSAADSEAPDWDGDGTTEMVADDGEWGGEAPARKNGTSDDEV